jgi:transcriptional regulator with XRE-family HTH domain
VTINEKIKLVRIRRNITQKEMGLVLGVAKETYRNIESGIIRLKLDDYLKICQHLEVSPSYFFASDEDKYMLVPRKELMELLSIVDKVKTLKNHIAVDEDTFDSDLHLYLADSSQKD